jgi:hypothetical protein
MPNTRYAAHLSGINGDALEVCHRSIVAGCDTAGSIASSRYADLRQLIRKGYVHSHQRIEWQTSSLAAG